MAIDKAIDSTQLNTDLTSIADAIREKAGLTDSFVFPVGFVEAIAGIEAGGGELSVGDWKIQSGTFTTLEDVSSNYVISLDEIIEVSASVGRYNVAFWVDNPVVSGGTKLPKMWVWSMYFNNVFSSNGASMGCSYGAYTDAYGTITGSKTIGECVKASGYNITIPCTANKMLCAGCTYRWIGLTKRWE